MLPNKWGGGQGHAIHHRAVNHHNMERVRKENRLDQRRGIFILLGKMTASLRRAIHFDSKPSVLQHTAMFPITTLQNTAKVATYPFAKCAKFARAVLGPCTLFLLLFGLF